MMSRYYDEFSSITDVNREFKCSVDDLKDVEILFAAYTYEDYEGDAIVIFNKNNKMYMVEGGHCSCYGLEGQWGPVETTKETIEMRLDRGNNYGIFGRYSNQIREAIQ